MGKVSYSPGIEYVQGSLAKPKKQNGHNHGDYLIGTHRTAATTNPYCTRIYIRKGDTYVRTTEPSSKELAARVRFSTASLPWRKTKLRSARRKTKPEVSRPSRLGSGSRKVTAMTRPSTAKPCGHLLRVRKRKNRPIRAIFLFFLAYVTFFL